MLTIQAMADIAMRHATFMSDAMIVACVQRHHRTGEPLVIPTVTGRRASRPAVPADRTPEDLDADEWRRMVERNADTRWQHV